MTGKCLHVHRAARERLAVGTAQDSGRAHAPDTSPTLSPSTPLCGALEVSRRSPPVTTGHGEQLRFSSARCCAADGASAYLFAVPRRDGRAPTPGFTQPPSWCPLQALGVLWPKRAPPACWRPSLRADIRSSFPRGSSPRARTGRSRIRYTESWPRGTEESKVSAARINQDPADRDVKNRG